MSEVFSIRIPRELKRELEELKNFVDIKEEVIKFLEERVEMYRRLKALREVHEVLEKHPTIPRRSATRLVREDRDSC